MRPSELGWEAIMGLHRQEIEALFGEPLEKTQTDKHKLWVYYYSDLEIYFDTQDVVDWMCTPFEIW